MTRTNLQIINYVFKKVKTLDTSFDCQIKNDGIMNMDEQLSLVKGKERRLVTLYFSY